MKLIHNTFLILFTLTFLQSNGQTWSAASQFNDIAIGAEYGRMVELPNGHWLSVFTTNNTTVDGLDLVVSRSTDHGRTWTAIAMISDAGRQLDNGQMQVMPDGSILLACRSVIWGTSFRLPVYRSTDQGERWTYLSTIDLHEGAEGTLEAQGMYEPHLQILVDGRLAVMYANESHVTGSPAYSQIISEKISTDGGATWGREIYVAWDPAEPAARPGMSVWTKMLDGRYILAYEVCGTRGCDIYYKFSNDGYTWAQGLGNHLPGQSGAPYVISMSTGRLYLTSNNGALSYSNNYGATWATGTNPWGTAAWPDLRWSSLYETGLNELAAITTLTKDTGSGGDTRIKFATVKGGPGSHLVVSGGVYKLTHKGTNQCLDVAYNSAGPGANVQQATDNGGTAQRWIITLQPDGYYKLRHQGTTQVLDVSGGSTTAGANVQQWDDLGGSPQRWKIEPMAGGHFKLVNKGTHNCLDVTNGSSADGTNVMVWTDHGNDAQRWTFELMDVPIVNGGTYRLNHKGTNQMLDVNGNSNVAGTNVMQWYDLANDAQQWILTEQEEGSYKLMHQGTTQVLDVAGGSATAGTNVQQWDDLGGSAQRWVLTYMGGGYFKLTHLGTNQCLDVSESSSSPGANVQQWTDNDGDAQRWRLDLVPGSIELATIENNAAMATALTAYPNPFEETLTVDYTATATGPVILQLTDASGQVVYTLYRGTLPVGTARTFSLEKGMLKKGLYYLQVTTSYGIQTIRVVVAAH